MSAGQQVPASASTLERRFYPRIAPRRPTFVAFEENNRALLINVSENGLLVSIPAVLPRNFVARAFVSLNGLPTPVRVSVRVIWVSEGRKQAGLQLLDLTDHDRELIRKWGAQQDAPSVQADSPRPRVAAAPSTTLFRAAHARPSLAAAPLNMAPDLAPPPGRVVVRTRSTSMAASIAMWGVLVALVCSASVFFLRHGPPGGLFPRSTENLKESTAAPSQEIQGNPQIPDAPELNAASPKSLPPNADAASSQSAPPRASALRHAAQSRDEATGPDTAGLDGTGDDGASPQVSAVGTPPTRREVSTIDSTPSSTPTSQDNPPSDVSRPAASTQFDPPNDPSRNRMVLAADGSKAGIAPSTSTRGGLTSATLTAVPNPPSVKRAPPNPMRPNEVFPSASTMLSSSPIIASTRPVSSRRSDASVIQMDAPGGQVMEIHPTSRFHSSFFNLPGERVLESNSTTIHIQRSVRVPPAHAWWPFNRNKKVVVGELVSRVDPQDPQNQIGSVRVNASVSADGRIENVRPINGPANLVPSVVKAIREWRYQPTLLDDKPVETECYVVVQFHSPNRAARP
jgi:hypothetical protein